MNLPTGYYLQNGKYQLLRIVGQGGFGITYKGVLFTEVKGPLGRIKTEVPISIKEYFFKDYCYRNKDDYSVNVHSETGRRLFEKFKEKLIKEAKILSDVRHSNIVNVLDVFEENDTAYIAMEYISGHSLKYILEKEGILPEQKVLKYIHQIGQALQFVHEKNIVHLDIKPSNILIDQNDNARLIDFGVSKRYDVEEHETSTTILTLSKGFASIEQYDNEGTQTFSPRPDIYSLGAAMYNLLTGKIPTESILRATRSMKDPSEFNPEISKKTEEVVLKAMQIDPESRFQSVQEMLEALDAPPPEEMPSNLLRRADQYEEDETTVLYPPMYQQKGKVDEEQTLLVGNGENGSPVNKKNKKVLLFSLIGVLVLIGSSVALLLGNGTLVPEQADIPPVVIDEGKLKTTPAEDLLVDNQKPEDTVAVDSVENKEVQNGTVERNDKPEETVVDTPPDTLEFSVQPTVEEIDKQYSELLTSGKNKMQAANFKGAFEDFAEAYRVKKTDEALSLIRESNVRLEEKLIEDRLALYEEKLTFGKLKIVRKKSSQMFGAIDEKGEEAIQCIYVDAERIDDSQYAFVRENNLFDIYDSSGGLLKSGVGTY